jgi:ABC-2 type transport system ATP-binding protein
MKDLLEITGLRKSFGPAKVLTGLDLSARRGEVIGILGRNGAGKTTLFRLILDLLEKDAGTVLLGGRAPDGSGAIRQRIGYVPEHPVFHPGMTAAEVFAFRSGFYPRWNMEKAVSTARRLELQLDKKTSAFSKGGLAKLAWCCAVAHDPDLLLLDEPTSGLDYLIKDKIMDGLIGELVSAEKTVMIASHVMEDVFSLTDRLAVLSAGGISSLHVSEELKTQAFLVSARLKSGAFSGKGAVLSSEGPLVSIGVIGGAGLEGLLASPELENAQQRSMTQAEIFRTLLAGTKEEL